MVCGPDVSITDNDYSNIFLLLKFFAKSEPKMTEYRKFLHTMNL